MKRTSTEDRARYKQQVLDLVNSSTQLTLDVVLKSFEMVGSKPLFSEYVNNTQPLEFICACGEKHKTEWRQIRQGHVPKCDICSGQKVTTEMVQKAFRDAGGEPLFDEYLGKPHSKLPFLCKCGNEHQLTYAKVQSGRKAHCPECGLKVLREKKRAKSKNSLEDVVKETFCKLGLVPLFDEYPPVNGNAHTYLPFICVCGEESKITWDVLRNRGKAVCVRCSNNTSPSEQILKECFDKSKAIQIGEYINNETPIDFKCQCGNLHSTRWSQLGSGTKAYCPDCQLLNRPRGEDHHNWKPEKTDEERKSQNRGMAFKKWSEVLLAANAYKCAMGSKIGTKLVAHHLNCWAEYPEERYRFNNCVVLSQEYHKEFHQDIGWASPTTREDFEKWYMEKTGVEFVPFLPDGLVIDVLDDPDDHLLQTKKKWCEKEGVDNYIPFFLPELTKSFLAVVSMLRYRSIDSCSQTIGARKLDVCEVDYKQAAEFLRNSHVLGEVGAHCYYGLTDGISIYALMSWGSYQGDWVLSRFAISPGYSVPGGASKLFQYSLDSLKPNYVVSYADRRFAPVDPYDSLYIKGLGFKYSHASDPSYWYSWAKTDLQNRRAFQRKYLAKKLPDFRPELSERENMELAGYTRYSDCGTFVYRY